MRAYAIGLLKNVDVGPAIVRYLERIDGTLAPFGGHFIVHGGTIDLLEGTDPGAVIVIEFPSLERAEAWYRSAPYQDILPLRTEHAESTAFLIEGVGRAHGATDVLATTG